MIEEIMRDAGERARAVTLLKNLLQGQEWLILKEVLEHDFAVFKEAMTTKEYASLDEVKRDQDRYADRMTLLELPDLLIKQLEGNTEPMSFDPYETVDEHKAKQ